MPDAAPNLPSPGATDPAELTPPARRRRRRRTWRRELIELCLIVIVVFVGMRMFLLPYQVDGASMTPYLSNGERLFVNRTAYAHIDLNAVLDLLPGEKHIDTNEFYPFSAPQRGDVIVLTPPTTSKEPYVKRIIGLPGETIAFHEGRVYVNGQPLAESYIDGAITYCYYGRWCSLKVPDDSVYVLGDNRMNSSDSRVFGPVKESAIIGKVIFSNWPPDKIGPITHPDYGKLSPD